MSESTPYAEFGAAFFAVAAFALEAVRRGSEKHRENLAAGNEAIMVLAQMYSVIRNYDQQAFVDRALEVRSKLKRDPVYIEYLPMTIVWNERSTLPMDRLGFLLKSHDADILNRLSLVERAFLSILAANKMRNETHLRFQERAREVLRPSESVPSHVVEEMVGFDLVQQLKQLTGNLQADIPRTVEALLSISTQLSEVLSLVFPTGLIMRYTPTAPARGVSPPASTRKAAWWRRCLRRLVNKWRKRRKVGRDFSDPQPPTQV